MYSPLFLVFSAILAQSFADSYVPGVYLPSIPVNNWTEFSQNGFQFAFSQCSTGASQSSPTFLTHWKHFAEMGIVRGALHTYQSCDSPNGNFLNANKNFFDKVDITRKDLFAVQFDGGFVYFPEELAPKWNTFLSLVEQKHGIKPIIITDKHTWDDRIGSAAKDFNFGAYPLWIVDTSNVTQPAISSPWKDFFIWTFSGPVQVKGVKNGAWLLRMK